MKAITVTYHGPTNHRGSRLIADDGDGNRVTMPYDCAEGRDERFTNAALALCRKMGWTGTLACGWLKNSAVFVFVAEHNVVKVERDAA